jgi:hypothetical protein
MFLASTGILSAEAPIAAAGPGSHHFAFAYAANKQPMCCDGAGFSNAALD